MTATYDCIATTTLGSAQGSITFSSISGSYTDLVLIIDAIASSGTTYATMQFNSDTGTNYNLTTMRGTGSAAQSARGSNFSNIELSYGNVITTGRSNLICQIMNYSNTTTYKTTLVRFNNAAVETGASVGLWRSTSAITSLSVSIASSTFASGSTFALYGVKAE